MTENPGPQYPPIYGDNEFTPPFIIIISYNMMAGHSGNNPMVAVPADIIDFYGYPYTPPRIAFYFEIIPESIATIKPVAYPDGAAAMSIFCARPQT